MTAILQAHFAGSPGKDGLRVREVTIDRQEGRQASGTALVESPAGTARLPLKVRVEGLSFSWELAPSAHPDLPAH